MINPDEVEQALALHWAWNFTLMLDNNPNIEPSKLAFASPVKRQEFMSIDLVKQRDYIYRKLTEGVRETAHVEALKVIILMAQAQVHELYKGKENE